MSKKLGDNQSVRIACGEFVVNFLRPFYYSRIEPFIRYVVF